MSLDKNKQLTFTVGTTDPLTIKSASTVESDFGSDYVVMIEPTIDGYTHFKPSQGLQNKMKQENVDVGDVITIEKAPKSDKWPYGYFSVNVVSKVGQKTHSAAAMNNSTENVEQQTKSPSDRLELHELSLRVESMAKTQAQMLTDIIELKKENNKLPL